MKLPRTEIKKARIEIIPMIDAIFFLLVFFMMTSLQMVQLDAKRVDLPNSTSPPRRPEGPKVVVSIAKNGDFYIDQNKVAPARLVSILAPKINADPRTTVILNIDRSQKIAGFSRLFDLVKQANPASVMIAATPKEPSRLPAGNRS